jgi:diguanylate cyclase (GGDEF)-like protein
VGVLCVGVDGLARINDALTHSGGDVLLTTVAARIAGVVPDPDLLARGSGDEFVVVLPGPAGGDEAGPLAEAIRAAARGPVQIDTHSVSASVSVGIATGAHGDSAVQLLRDASVAMRAAKAHGRDRIEFADEGVAAQAERRLVVEQEIREALADNRFAVWLQPIVTLETRAVVGQEALVRELGADGSVAAPASFLPVAERLGLVVDIDDVVLRTALDLLRSLPPEQYLSVNVAAASLSRPGYAERVTDALRRSGVDPTRLHLEVTETSLLRISDDVRDGMRALADLGVRWYVDDFGTGYSSITHLRDLPVSGLKLDLSFTRGAAAHDATSVRLAQALAGLADGLELDSVAEGIETADVAALLQAQGWQHGQGWLYGRPVPSEQVIGRG